MPISPLAWWLKYINKLMIGLQKLGVGFCGIDPVVLTVPGRKTGKPRSTAVTQMVVDGRRYIVAGVPGADWATNARTAEATVHQGRRSERARMVEVSAEDARPLLREFPIVVPTGVGFIKNACLVTGPNPHEFEALAGRCPVFRLGLLR